MVKRIEQFLLSNNVWVFLVLILLISNAYVLTIIADEQRLIYLSTEKWILMLKHFGMYVLLFSPMLLLVLWDRIIKNKLGKGLWCLLNSYAFAIHPFLLGQLEVQQYFIRPAFPGELFWIYGLFFLVVRLMLSWQSSTAFLDSLNRRLKSMKFEHLLILLLGLILIIATLLSQPKDLLESFWNALQLGFVFLLFYLFYFLNHYFLINKIFKINGLIHYGFSFLGACLIFFPILVFVMSKAPVFSSWVLDLEGSYWVPKGEGPVQFAVIKSGGIWLLFFLTIPLIVVIQWFQQNAKIGSLERDKSEAELSLLKQQINPHFFFNTLNNLYALSLTKDKQTPEVILQLSELMRYVIYKGKEKEVRITEEVNYIEDYIKLQQIRLHQDLEINFEVEIKAQQLLIPPLLFITLVENAFKHGIEPAEGPCFLTIKLKSDERSLVFICENSIEEKQNKESGIGLLNLERRLTLLFPNRHQFEVSPLEETFKVKLSIDF